eukprot:6140342-Amphidinium_carterae.2
MEHRQKWRPQLLLSSRCPFSQVVEQALSAGTSLGKSPCEGKAPQVDLIFSEDEEDEEEGSFFAELEREEAAKSAEVLTDSGLDADSVEEQLAADLRKRHRMHERAHNSEASITLVPQ